MVKATITGRAGVPTRKYDVALYGCTGFTGNLVAEYFAEKIDLKDKNWVLIGRSEQKLKKLKERLISFNKDLKDLDYIIASSSDQASLNNVAQQTKVVLTTVGPYSWYGEPMLKACVEAGTNYCDLTGEVPWMRKMMDKYGDKARETGSVIVPCSGYDCCPGDLLAYNLVQFCREKMNKEVKVRAYVQGNGKPSGGTVQSGFAIAETNSMSELKKFSGKFALNPQGTEPKKTTYFSKDVYWPKYDSAFKKTTGFWVMNQTNSRVIRRSAALEKYGDDFEYHEVAIIPNSFVGYIMGFVFAFIFPLVLFTPLRHIFKRIAPQGGDGPDKATRDKSWFKYHGIAFDKETNKPLAQALLRGGDPGYGETSKMISEVALGLSETHTEGGFHTPASALRDELVTRMQNTGMQWSIGEYNSNSSKKD